MGASDIKRPLGDFKDLVRNPFSVKNRFQGAARLVAGPYNTMDNIKNKPQPEEQEPIPSAASALPEIEGARDRMRRRAMRAQGLSSTIRAGSLATPVEAQGKSLLGS